MEIVTKRCGKAERSLVPTTRSIVVYLIQLGAYLVPTTRRSRWGTRWYVRVYILLCGVTAGTDGAI